MKLFRSIDSMDCGLVCLKMIVYHHGRDYPLSFLKEKNITKQGINLYNLGKFAHILGFKSELGKVTLDDLVKLKNLPCILHWDQSHFVVLYKIKNDKYYIADPASNKVILKKEEFKNYWLDGNTGLVLFLKPTKLFFEKAPKKKRNSIIYERAFGFLKSYFLKFKRNYLQVAFAMLLTIFISLILPFLTQGIVDYGINLKNKNFIVIILAFQFFLFLSTLFSDFVRSHLLLHISSRINLSILDDFLTKLLSLHLRFFESKLSGDIIERINDHRRIEAFITQTLLNTVFSIIKLLVFTSILAYYSFSMFLIFILGSIASIVWTVIFIDKRRSIDYMRFSELSNTNSKLYEMVNHLPEIKINNYQEHKKNQWQDIQIKLYKISLKSLTIDQYQKIGSEFFNKTRDILIMFVAALSVIEGEISLGMMLATSYILGQLSLPVTDIVNSIQTFQMTIIGLERMNEVYEQPNEEHSSLNQLDHSSENHRKVLIKNLNFRYETSERTLFENLSVEFPAKSVTAIVGESGSGKSTLIKLILKIHDPNNGQILVDGKDLKDISPNSWRSKCGVVLQEGHIFSDTLIENIVLGDKTIDLERVAKIIEDVNLLSFIQTLPKGLKTKIGESGIGLSKGQQQRILLARALYKDPEILILDEATSSLDANNESIIVKNLNNAFKNKTVIVAAHRLSTIKNADRIICLDKGKIVEQGTHSELLKTKGYYHQLVRNQLS